MKATFAFQWHITDKCDQRCKHCYIFAEHANKVLDTMSWLELQATLDNCIDFCETFNRQPHFYITGGDPILHKNFWQLLAVFKANNYPFTIMGNPFHLDDKTCASLKNYGCTKYQMSIDGMRDTHDYFRKHGSFDCTIEKISTIKNAGIRAVIMTTVSKININEIPAIIDTIANVADVYAFARYCPTADDKTVGITPLEYRNLLDVCHKKFIEYEAAGCETYFNRKDHLWTLYEYEKGLFKIPANIDSDMIYGGCNCGNSHLTILPNGDVYACRRVLDSKVGNVFENRLVDIWLNEMETYREFDKFKKCATCELLAWCRGCPAVAKSTSGSFYDADPQCWK